MAGLPTDPVEIARLLLRQEGVNRVLRLRLQEIKDACKQEWDGDTGSICSKIISIVDREMPKEVM